MPKKVATKRTYGNINLSESFKNVCDVIADVVGSTATVDTSSDWYDGRISLESLGFPEMEIQLKRHSSSGGALDVFTRNKEIDIGPQFSGTDGNGWQFSGSVNNEFTAVCARDQNNDSIVVCVTSGENSEASSTNHSPIVIFVGRDVNDNILHGAGLTNGHIEALCSGLKVSNVGSPYGINKQIVEGGLHVTKMINYLAEGMPEMKSAYVSVLRPTCRDSKRKDEKNLSYYAGGSLWFIPGDSTSGIGLYTPIDPIIKY